MLERILAILGLRRSVPQVDLRSIHVGDGFPPGPYVQHSYRDNTITSSKYTLWNFIPKNLFEQFRRIANLYFLMVFLIQLLVDTPTSPVTSGVPLLFVITVTAIKQGYEDWLRHRADGEANHADVYTVKSGHLVRTRCKHVRVGDIVYVRSEESFPCDLVLLASNWSDGRALVTTASLDGETDLKTYFAPARSPRVRSPQDFSGFSAAVECRQPQPDLYRFEGHITIHNTEESELSVPDALGPENLLLRGTRLKNTDFIYGAAVYTGMETKMALNYRSKSQKRSVVEVSMNSFLLVYLCLLLCEALLGVVLKSVWQMDARRGGAGAWYNEAPPLGPAQRSATLQFLVDFLDFLILFNYVIPTLQFLVDFLDFLILFNYTLQFLVDFLDFPILFNYTLQFLVDFLDFPILFNYTLQFLVDFLDFLILFNYTLQFLVDFLILFNYVIPVSLYTLQFLVDFLDFLILFNYVIPVSLYTLQFLVDFLDFLILFNYTLQFLVDFLDFLILFTT
ncbi:phospholipid-transporting ATPase IH-like [Lethenteron reissneri]|uniref:phospholipid-transporting ATPase IH-like n=1 Tax=Lethenteron reissneri TaxID=7753 RepID=UPI002AB61B20|nr:phospholipid-transporting ATPase IH-like [Lethenteron reissneri]